MQLPEYNSALEAYNQGKYQTSITLVNKAIDINNEESEFYVLRARANYKIGNKNLAMDDLNKSLSYKKEF